MDKISNKATCSNQSKNINNFSSMCSSQKYPYSPHIRDWNFLGVGGTVRPKNLKKCMKVDRNFQRGGERNISEKKSLLWGRYGYFLELHNVQNNSY